MKKRSTEIIQEIIKTNKTYTLEEFTSNYHVSQKTLRNDIKEINLFLASIPVSELEITQSGEIRRPANFDVRKIKTAIYRMDPYVYRLSTEERRIYIMMMLAVESRYVTMQHFADVLCVSRVTVVNDMESIKDSFTEFHAHLLLDPGKGMLVECGRDEKIDLLIRLFKMIAVNNNNEGFFQRMIFDNMEIRFSFAEIFSYIQEYLEVSNIIFVEDVLYDIVVYLFVVFNFCKMDDAPIMGKEKLDGIDHMIIYTGYMLNCAVTTGMLVHFRQYLSRHQLHSFVKTIDEVDLYKTIQNFIEAMEEDLSFDLIHDSKLMDSLLLHIKNGRKWGNYDVEFPDEHNGVIDYHDLQALVEKNAYILEDYLSYQLTDNMIKSIVIHLCVSIIRNTKKGSRCLVAIVCPGSMATGKYLELQIRNYFDFEIAGTYSAGTVIRTLNKEEQAVDFIISTVPVRTSQYEVIEVNPSLTMEDLNLIQKKAFEIKKSTDSSTGFVLAKIKSVIYNEISDPELADKLCESLTETAREYQQKQSDKKKNALAQLLKVDNIQIVNEPISWERAFYLSAEPLITDGSVQKQYVDRAVENIKEYGDYMIVSPGVVLVHAEKKYGAVKDGLSLLVAPHGALFSESGETGYLIFCFSNAGDNKYLELLRVIINLGKDSVKVQEICRQEMIGQVYDRLIYSA